MKCQFCITPKNLACAETVQMGPLIGYWCRRKRHHKGPHVACHTPKYKKHHHCISILHSASKEYLTFTLKIYELPLLL